MRLDLYLVTDPDLTAGRPLLQVVAAALEGGVTAVQLRDKRAAPRDLLALGAEMRRIARRHQATFIVNDRVDLALALDADGVHVGAEDLPPLEARRLAPRPRLVGVSAGTVQEAQSAERAGADYLGAGPVFATATKAYAAGEPIGLSGLAAIASAVSIPVVGIGGIDSGNASSVIEVGAAGVAVISAIVGARDPEAAAREILSRVREALGRRGALGPAAEGRPER
jgi:thiamine-phosphate pyrophosphorylase